MEQCEDNSSVGCQETEIKVCHHPSGEKGWKTVSSLRDVYRLLLFEERRTCKITSRRQRVELCSRKDNVKVKEGNIAEFTEQSASASQMAATKFSDTISKLLGMAGERSGAFDRKLKSI